VGKGRCVAGILQLSEHFVVGENLRRKRRRQSEQMPQKRGLGDFLQLEHVPRQNRFDPGCLSKRNINYSMIEY